MSMESGQSTAASMAVGEVAVNDLRSSLRGQLLGPADEGYDAARRIWNGMIDRRPALIARCAGASDVIAAVRFARAHGLLVSIRGGGHNVAGNAVCDGGLMIDLSPMKGIRVDPVARTARAEPGVLWGEFDHETHAFGLATPGGTVSTTGIAGLTLGGGQSWLTGKHGMSIDNLISADVVTAEGKLLRASAAEHEDLFWGIRGAGANLGVVTSFEYRLHPVSTVLGGMVIHPFDRAKEVLRFYREFTADQPDELTTYAALLTSPEGALVVALAACYAGPLEAGARSLAPLRRFGAPVADTFAPIPYTVMQGMLVDAVPPGRQYYWKGNFVKEISQEFIDVVVDHTARVPSPFTIVLLAHNHGAYSRVGKTDTAYYHRDLQYDLVILSGWDDPVESDRNVQWTRAFFADAQPHLAHGVYVNALDRDEGTQRVRDAYRGNYERLVALKTKYDPSNFFRMNQNIKPTM